MPRLSLVILIPLVLALAAVSPRNALGSKPTVAQALELTPVQADIELDVPRGADADACRLEAVADPGVTGWAVYDKQGQLLRRFLDTNNDKRIDRWCYYQRGIEVYRDIDADFNGKADQYRWLGTAGSRWGLDTDEDGRIDGWKMISPEEVTAEVVAAIRARDASRFRTVLLDSQELARLGLGTSQTNDLKQRIETAMAGFAEFADEQRSVTPQSRWIHFGATRPGVIPEGTDGSTRDLLIYDNVAAVLENDGKHSQLIVGTLVQVGSGWRVIDLPQGDGSAGFFYTSLTASPGPEAPRSDSLDESMQQLLSTLEEIDGQLSNADPSSLSKLNARRADVLDQLAERAATEQERDAWTRQLADTVSAATQSGDYPDGVARLKSLVERLDRAQAPQGLRAYVQFRYMTAAYGQQLQEPNADFAKVQENWLKSLEDFVQKHPGVDDAAEAMLQLGIAQEFAGQQQEAIGWYGRIFERFPDSDLSQKAAGAKRRLESVGKSISLEGQAMDGSQVDLSRYQGRVVLVHYWATWCEPCKQDMQMIRALQAKLPAARFAVIGVNLDTHRETAAQFLRAQRLPWPQVYEPGGLDSRLANEMGILTLPTMLLLDQSGRVVRKNIHSGELEDEVGKLVK